MTDTKQICEAIKGLPDDALVYVDAGGIHNRMFKAKTLKALVAENEALKEHLANTLNNHGDLYTLLRHYPNALAEVRQIPDVTEWWLDKAYGVTPCVMVRYDRDDPKTERIRVGNQSDLEAKLQLAVEANRYALAIFRTIGQWTFEDSDHGLLIAEAVKKLEAFQDEIGEQR